MTEDQRKIMLHSIGKPDGMDDNEPYRNRFVASESHDDWEILETLVFKGFMKKQGPYASMSGAYIFHVTTLGMRALKK